MKKMLILACLGLVMAAAGAAMAQSEPIQLSLTPDIAIQKKTTHIKGLTIGIWGENPQEALAIGFVNGSTGSSTGLSLGFFVNYADSYKGVQWAAVNYTKVDFLGWQSGIVNYAKGPMKGLQTGIVNYADHLTGLQFGFLNYADKATQGVQIGFVNMIPRNELFTKFPNELAPGMIIVNWRF